MLHFIVVFAVLMAGMARADEVQRHPAELPPPQFDGAQYIDSGGCVFMRAEGGWLPRLDGQGRAVCGYPPTMAAMDAPGFFMATSAAPAVGAGESLEQRVVRALAPGLQSVGLTGDTLSPARLPSAPVSHDIGTVLAGAVRMVPVSEAARSGGRGPNERLCNLLGYAPAGDGARANAAAGHCSAEGGAAQVQEGRQADSASVDRPKPEAAKPKVTSSAQRAVMRREERPVIRAASAPSAPAERPAVVPHIPAGARYVQIGVYRNEDDVQRAVQRLVTLGYPVVRATDRGDAALAVVMAGPFETRERIVSALNHLRSQGYPNAVPR
ncbi:MAG: SPOR domain-containing protein [Paracoccus sp. (in: a-proteobacteria)]|uniref:SPOR domain-containing protein n=1 Tax=Paracoccus sp. TaxID=267 RepID=UPI0026DFF1E3|nr:SPOR domain-containing protein [Paracoccus sp. (in: a-proteobacteria)]MDO5620537.1 SPOR domain-containing protein [Paracoccus sp. (in: a-proteobacteria)]